MSPETVTPPPRWRPLPLLPGLWIGSFAAVAVTFVRMFVHVPMPDVPIRDVDAQAASLHSLASKTQDGVRMEIPQHWTFACYSHPSALENRVHVPGIGDIPIGSRRTVLVAAGRDQGRCA